MPSKYCPDCKDIITCNFIPKYCCWCGRDLQKENILPEFATFEDRKNLLAELQTCSKYIPQGQISLF